MQIIINATDDAGLNYGITTLMQLVGTNNPPLIKPCKIVDAPQFPIRWFYYPMNIWFPTISQKRSRFGKKQQQQTEWCEFD